MSICETATAESGGGGPISRVLRPIRARLALAAGLAALGSMLSLLPLAGILHIAQLALGEAAPTRDEVWRVIGMSVLAVWVGMSLVLAAELLAHLADTELSHGLRLRLVRHLAQLPLGWFTERSSGQVKQALQDDIGTLHGLTAHFYTAVARVAGVILVSALYLFALDWRLAIVALLPLPGFFLFLRRAMRAGAASMAELVAGQLRINSATAEFIAGLPVLKAFGQGGRAHQGYREAVDAFAQAFTAFTRPLVGPMAHAHALIAPVTVLGLVLLSGTLFMALGWIRAVELLPFVLVAPGVCAPVLLLHTLLHELGSATAAAQRVLALLDTPLLAPPPAGSARLPEGHEVCFEDVGYAYEGQAPLLSDISFTLRPGTVTAVVGPSGAGKSTLARLLLRFFDPTQGRITLGGVDLRQLDSPVLYRQIGFVLQEVQLIHASLRDNIALGRPAASQQEVEAAARAAQIHARILALPRGYDSVLGEDAQLSGGERQRLSIARALLLDPPVLVLDEATSAADAGTELALQQALARLARGRSLLLIAHRLDTVRHADHILVLDGGRLLEQGSHAELLALQGRYARLWALGGETLC
ncbi:ATP-binding cassette subfamily B protein [Paucibacter oligotrophus]|uniref:ATP-binding cassette subfamily B protein n=1 Tax=Roseateles oligotrophus TaxID=1769250 RepID=A0A840LDD9_9BURK|nr:ABC transporter ATP-binding protein [Roseateles oligotrophus]MBB4845731.1 ATP-binding cassette subfamily B protein [Roseateles oligotrophus]